MPYLNWKNAPIQKNVGSHPSREFLLELFMSEASLKELLPRLEELFLQNGTELRVDFPDEWIVFWKLRDGESRMLMAHPQPEEWVATVALEATHGSRLIDALRGLRSGDSVEIGTLAPIGPVSNVEVLIRLS